MAAWSYNRSLDTLATAAADDASSKLIQIFSDGGNRLLESLAANGRIMQVKDTEEIVTPLLFQDGGDAIVGHALDNFGGSTLALASKEILQQARYTMAAWSRNVAFSPTMPTGDQVNYMTALFTSAARGAADHIESSLLLGNTTFDGDNPVRRAPFSGDADWDGTNFLGMSLYGLVASGTEKSGLVADLDKSDEAFAGVTVDNSPKWAPTVQSGTANGSTLIADIDNFVRDADFGNIERPTHVWVGTSVFEQIIDLLRTGANLVNSMDSNLGYGSNTIPIGDIKVHRHRHLDTKDILWDLTAGATAEYPIIFLNYNSFRMNVVAQGLYSASDSQETPAVGFMKSYPGIFPDPTSTDWFKRVECKFSYSLEAGRRSMGQLEGITL